MEGIRVELNPLNHDDHYEPGLVFDPFLRGHGEVRPCPPEDAFTNRADSQRWLHTYERGTASGGLVVDAQDDGPTLRVREAHGGISQELERVPKSRPGRLNSSTSDLNEDAGAGAPIMGRIASTVARVLLDVGA
jgi:hypothetical protein